MKNNSWFIAVLITGFLPAFIHAETNSGFDLSRGTFYAQNETKNGTKLSAEIGVSSRLSGSGAVYFEQSEVYGGFDTWLDARIGGDVGN
ncbi:MAG: hypothetical protein LBI94_09315, partial [Treponema sp.]|nr:hypothetical protein [Treponema sp.]